MAMARLGVDFGGTKIEVAALGDDGRVIARRRVPNPGRYEEAIAAVGALVAWADAEAGTAGAPMTYMLGGQQYVVVACGGGNVTEELMAYRLPRGS